MSNRFFRADVKCMIPLYFKNNDKLLMESVMVMDKQKIQQHDFAK